MLAADGPMDLGWIWVVFISECEMVERRSGVLPFDYI